MAAAGSLGRFLGPALAVLPLPADFSTLARPLQGAVREAVNAGYQTAFTVSAILVAAATVCALMLRVPKEQVAEAAAPAPVV